MAEQNGAVATKARKKTSVASKRSAGLNGPNGRIAVVAGVRTPFTRIATAFRDQDAVDLGAMAAAEVLARTGLAAGDIEQAIFGMTVMKPEAPFIAREIVLASGMDARTDAYSITRACATSFQTAASGAEAIALGNANVVMTGGTDSTSDISVPLSKRLADALRDASQAKTNGDRLKILTRLRPKDLIPRKPSITEYSTGKTMGESAEQMAKTWGVTRAEQDDLAHASHTNAAAALADGRLDAQRMTAFVANNGKTVPVSDDNLVRTNSERTGYDRLKPIFDRANGSVTAANSSPLTDGAAAMILMSEERAKALGYEPLAYIRGYAFAAKTPERDLLMGPVLAAPLALERAGLSLSDLTLIDMHEAFAAQVEANIRGMESKTYLPDMTGQAPLGTIDRDILNVNGGSIAFGHPFGATGARILIQTAHELKRRGGGLAMTTACAAGGIGAAMILERD
ncbi:3-ketoacyl-CoA thiolase protein [Salinisphaera shabanensis E1L3A]|uniref:3-ketoacyl-CoA thiolase protein n=1 Tax=Salinisphaera shabanensis E1L3A TaxID=1033802 RepID=U2ENK4_9GAMM|nr:acetyl-CoA C-acyltransferase FadI [Salinisphaera shabanensis]ERJ19712.1 3-ketoacyl-CoA thiolase protein [Salinisphaera shabanensis E1L3A]